MTEYRIELVKTPGLTEDERKRRLKRAFDILLDFRVNETADGDTLAGEPSADIAPILGGQDTRGIVADGE